MNTSIFGKRGATESSWRDTKTRVRFSFVSFGASRHTILTRLLAFRSYVQSPIPYKKLKRPSRYKNDNGGSIRRIRRDRSYKDYEERNVEYAIGSRVFRYYGNRSFVSLSGVTGHFVRGRPERGTIDRLEPPWRYVVTEDDRLSVVFSR